MRSSRTTNLRLAAVLLTGRYYEMSIQSVEFGPRGMLKITYDNVIT